MPSITVISGNIAKIDADLYVNSANGLLLNNTGAAGQYSDFFGPAADENELRKFQELIGRSKASLSAQLARIYDIEKRIPTRFQYECLKEIIGRRDSREIPQGDAVLIRMVTDAGEYLIANAVGMTYDWTKENLPVIPATYETVYNSLVKSLGFAEALGCKTVAIPVMCTRKGGLSKEVSSEATLSAIERAGGFLDKVFIVLYNKELEADNEFFESFYSSF